MAKVLAVDDEEGVIKIVRAVLAWNNHQVTGAGSAEEALAAVQRESFDVALVDLRLPGMDGLTLARRLAETHPALRVVLLTGMTGLNEADLGFPIVTKPFDFGKLIAAVED